MSDADRERYRLAFNAVPKGNKDYITLKEFNTFISNDPNLTDQERQLYYKRVNADGNDKISFKEFAYWSSMDLG